MPKLNRPHILCKMSKYYPPPLLTHKPFHTHSTQIKFSFHHVMLIQHCNDAYDFVVRSQYSAGLTTEPCLLPVLTSTMARSHQSRHLKKKIVSTPCTPFTSFTKFYLLFTVRIIWPIAGPGRNPCNSS